MARLLDLHIHPTLKMYYLPFLRNSFHSFSAYAGNHWNPLSFRSRYNNLKDSPEKVMLCAHYPIERGFVAKGLKLHSRAVSWLGAPLFYGKLRMADPWKTTLGMMNSLEKSVKNSNRWIKKDQKRFKLIRRYEEIAELEENEIGLVHAIEGSHALGYGPVKNQSIDDFWQQTLERLDYLNQQGVCMITLAHFWENMFAPQTCGTEYVPKKVNGQITAVPDDAFFHMQRGEWEWNDPNKLADQFARKLLEMGILIDISHSQPDARSKVYDLCKEYNRPVIGSHVGLRHFFDHEYNLSDEEVKKINDIDGVVGLILSRRWLVDPIKRYKSSGEGINDLVENMLYIGDLTGDIKCIGIGTDFDGLTDPFKDCYIPSQLDRIVDAMARHFTDDEIDQILYRNSLQALEKGWSKK